MLGRKSQNESCKYKMLNIKYCKTPSSKTVGRTWAQAQPAWPSNTPSSIPRVCRHVAALLRSSMGALAGSWLLSKPITDDTFFPSNSGTWKCNTCKRSDGWSSDNKWFLFCFFSACMNGSTNLEAVLVGFKNGVDLWRSEDVAAEDWGCLETSWVLVTLPHVRPPSWGRLVSNRC